MDRLREIANFIAAMPKRYLGAGIGVLAWIFLEVFGFFPTLLLTAFVAVGYGMGKLADRRANWLDVIERILQSEEYDP